MQINNIQTNTQNFGMVCPSKFRAFLRAGLNSEGTKSLFENCDVLARKIKTIGAGKTTLKKIRINCFGPANSPQYFETVDFVLGVRKADGKEKNLTLSIFSPDRESCDIVEPFKKLVQDTEEVFIKNQILDYAKKGKLDVAKDYYLKTHPEYTDFINKITKPLEETIEIFGENGLLTKFFRTISKAFSK